MDTIARVRRAFHIQDWSQNRGAATAEGQVPLCHAPGGAYQVDWSHEIILISGITVTVTVAHVRLYHSRMMSPGPLSASVRSLSHRA